MARKQTAPATPAATLPVFPAAELVAMIQAHDQGRSVLINGWIDQARSAGLKASDDASAKAASRAVRRALEDAGDVLADATVAAYAQGAARAIFWGVQWTPNLHSDKTRKLPGASRPGSTTKTVSRATVDEKVGAALEALRVFGLTAIAAEMIDVIRKAFPDWEEPAGK